MLRRGRELGKGGRLLFLVPFWTPPPSDRKSATNYGSGQKKERKTEERGVSQSHYLTVAVQPGAFLTGQGRERK